MAGSVLRVLLLLTCVFTTAVGFIHAVDDDQYSHAIYIDRTHGEDSIACVVNVNDATVPCRSLDWSFRPEFRRSSMKYVLLNGPLPHLLSLSGSDATFANLSTVAFVGNETETTIQCTGEDAGLAFVNMSKLVLTNITFIGCSSERNSTSRNFTVTDEFVFSTVQVSLYFYHCHNVSMTNMTVDSPGSSATGVIMYDSDGTVTITNSTFKDCAMDYKRPGGGGFYVEFSYCVPGDTQCGNNSEMSFESRNRGAQYHFLKCTFSNNTANNVAASGNSSTYILPFRSQHEAFGRGGGLSIFVKGNASDNMFKISGCLFSSNEAQWGAGLFVEFQDNTYNNSLVVSHSQFENNNCNFTNHSGTGGGGVRIGHFENHPSNDPSTMTGNDVTLNACYLKNNSALNGGGVSIHSTLKQGSDVHAYIYITDSTFIGNVARLGAAVYVTPFSIFRAGNTLTVYITQCEFLSNSVQYTYRIKGFQDNAYQIGAGAVYINKVDVHFEQSVVFFNNNGSALVAVGTGVSFKADCKAIFTNNTGSSGGAISLLGAAYIQIGDNVSMNFHYNKAISYGGAIYNKYIEKEFMKTDLNCFIQHEDLSRSPHEWHANFYFTGNKHQGNHSNAIYSTSLLPCSWTGNGFSNLPMFCDDKEWNFTTKCEEQLSSDIGQIEYKKSAPDSEKDFHLKAYPGKAFMLPITVRDDANNTISLDQTVFGVTSTYNQTYKLEHFTHFCGESATLKEAPNQTINLQLYSLGDREWHVDILVDMQSCPPGFKSVELNGNLVCNCSNDYNGLLICDHYLFSSYLKSGHWMGKIQGLNDEAYLVGQCPPGYCASSNISMHLPLLSTEEKVEKLICGEKNRQGVLCGNCLEGFGIAVNTLNYDSACVQCNETEINIGSNIAKYGASVYLPLFVMFTILILFDIRLTTGPANAFILYCQVVTSTFDLNADGQIPLDHITRHSDALLQAFQIPYSIFNLEFMENFFPPLCFGTHFNMLSVFALDYIVAVFPLLMIFLVILSVKTMACISTKCCWNVLSVRHTPLVDKVIGKISSKFTRSTEAVLPAFSAFLLLSYTKFSTVSSYLLKQQSVIDEDGIVVASRIYYAGTVEYSFSIFLKYYLPAILVFIMFVITTPLILLDYPMRAFEWALSKVKCLWKLYPVDKVHVLLDTFQGCFKNKMRFFAGLYFVFRLVVNVSYIITTSWLEQFMIQQIACTIMIILLALFRPYKKTLLNIVDILIFANLAILNALSFYMYSYSLYNPKLAPPVGIFAFQYLLVFIPLIYMVSYITWRIIPCCQHYYLRMRDRRTLAQPNTRNNFSVKSTKQEESDIEALLVRAEEENLYQPPTEQPASLTKQNTERSSLNSRVRDYGSTDMT